MSEESQAPTEVTPEAYQRVISERDEARTRSKELETQLTAFHTVSAAERFLRSQKVTEEEIPGRLELLAPHLKDVASDDVPSILAEDRFKPLITVVNAPATTSDGEPAEEPADGRATSPLGFGGPAPSGDGKPPDGKRYNLRSPEVQEMIRLNKTEELKSLMESDQWDAPVRNY